MWLFCCGPSSSPNVWLRPTYHVLDLGTSFNCPQLRERDDHLRSSFDDHLGVSFFYVTQVLQFFCYMCSNIVPSHFDHLKCKELPLAVESILQWILFPIPVFDKVLSLLRSRFSVLRWRSICGILDESGRAIFQIHDHSEELGWNGVITKNTAVRGLIEIE